jgi:hypothetical protein
MMLKKTEQDIEFSNNFNKMTKGFFAFAIMSGTISILFLTFLGYCLWLLISNFT